MLRQPEPVSRSDGEEKIVNPAITYEKPHDILRDSKLSAHEKKDALSTWEQDARQLLTASNEGMAGPREGLVPEDRHRLGEVVRAKVAMGEAPKHKASH